MVPPAYFEQIRSKAERRWDQLEADPDLAGPWRQLFAQVQSPRHVLSELLQNADDTGATEASVQFEDGVFVFAHNGGDFVEEHFQSLCRFAYSNKRSLHTIGFRGIGFKSTFSLGDEVGLRTPSLTVAFHRQRFTEPQWIDGPPPLDSRTRIQVRMLDEARRAEIAKNLRDWVESPVSLLFFRHIRKLTVGDQELHWRSLGPGPAPDSEWMALDATPAERFLVVRSAPVPFPDSARDEIAQERQLGSGAEIDFPPCRVEIVLGARGSLYVVLPTGVTTSLPFACNAPFIQDPARLKIKDPEISPTNRWLLKRAGQLAATAMLGWLRDESLGSASRSVAYGLLPNVDRKDHSLEGSCGTLAEEAFSATVRDSRYLLTAQGGLECAGECVILPDELLDVWPSEQAASLLDPSGREALSPLVSRQNRVKLLNLEIVENISVDDVLKVMTTKSLPVPARWEHLLTLWHYLAPKLTAYWYRGERSKLRLVPAQGKERLCAAADVVRLGERRLLHSDADWEFLADKLLVLNQNWPRFLAERRRDAQDDAAPPHLKQAIDAGYEVLKALGLEDTSDHNKVLEQVASTFFGGVAPSRVDSIRLAQIAAKLGITVGASFRYVTRDDQLRGTENAIIHDPDGQVEDLLLPAWAPGHLLHEDYLASPSSCTETEWRDWLASERSGLLGFLPLSPVRSWISGRHLLEPELKRRGMMGAISAPYVTWNFYLDDWDFDAQHWQHWQSLASETPSVWVRLMGFILDQPEARWRTARTARAYQVATTGTSRQVTQEPIQPAWILKFRELPCLPDTRGFYRKPAELLRRTEATEALIDVEPFVHARLDTEAVRPLLSMLGVSEQSSGPELLLSRLRALSQSEQVLLHEIERWYRRLDQMIGTCSTEALEAIRGALVNEPLVLTIDLEWACGSAVFQTANDEDAPGAALIHTSVRGLALWGRIGIPERPTADLAVRWLQQLPSRSRVEGANLSRIRALLGRHPHRVWTECGHWINLSGEWAPVGELHYAVSMASLVQWQHLYRHVLARTADLRMLNFETAAAAPFAELKRLTSHLEERPDSRLVGTGEAVVVPWLNQFGLELQRIELDAPEESQRLRTKGDELANTIWRVVSHIQMTPYLDQTPAGTPRTTEVLWHQSTLYVQNLPPARLARLVPDRLGKALDNPEVTAALHYCFGRTPDQVTEYLEENFRLAPRRQPPIAPDETEVSPHGSPHLAGGGECLPLEAPGNGAPVAPTGDTAIDPQATPEPAVRAAQPVEGSQPLREPARPTPPQRDPPAPKLLLPPLIERFALRAGFLPNGSGGYTHPNGERLTRVTDEPFPWQRQTAGGEWRRSYWPKEHCLEREPLQLESDLWTCIEDSPERYALLVTGPNGDPLELTGVLLRRMRESGQLTLYPASYRLVVKA